MQTESAFIAIVGRPNVGKSTLLNRFLGQKVAIVSNKPQTTRTKIMGVLTQESLQLVFIDTPGLHKPRNKLGEKMVRSISEGMSGVDACLMVVEPLDDIRLVEKELIARFRANSLPAILAINKIDTLPDKEKLMLVIARYAALYDFKAIVPVSAKKGNGLDELLEELKGVAAPSPHFFEDDTLTDQTERSLAAEMLREKLLVLLNEEIPHGIAVSVERMREREEQAILDIEAVIYCERESHKGIIIGKKGAMLKKASTLAREDLEQFFQCKVNLQVWVKVKEDWRNREGIIRNFGLD